MDEALSSGHFTAKTHQFYLHIQGIINLFKYYSKVNVTVIMIRSFCKRTKKNDVFYLILFTYPVNLSFCDFQSISFIHPLSVSIFTIHSSAYSAEYFL